MIDQERLTIASRGLLEKNLRLLQGYRLAPTDEEHIARLLDYMAPAPNTLWVDIGCGFGEPARIMQELRPDLKFWLINNNEYQLEHVPVHMLHSNADMHHLPFCDGLFDGAMFLFSLCHADNVVLALREAARVVRPGGKLFVFDYVRMIGDDKHSRYYLDSSFLPVDDVPSIVHAGGWDEDSLRGARPNGTDEVFRSVFGDQLVYDLIFNELQPVIWWVSRK